MNTISPKMNISVNGKRRVIQSSKQNRGTSFKANPVVSLITKEDQKLLNIFSQNYGPISDKIGLKLGKLATEKGLLERNSRFVLEKGVSSVKQKSMAKSALENAMFPITRLPMYIANWLLQQGRKIPGLAKKTESIYRSDPLRIPRKLNEIDEKTDILKGMYDKTKEAVTNFAKTKGKSPEEIIELLNNPAKSPKTDKLVKEANDYIRENLYKVSNKFFDKNKGNFNTVYERPLNRIVTGLIPVAFLANDAYNLSVLCGDSKEVSQKEAKERKKQEISRVFTTAYIQLITLGALTKQVNANVWVAPLTSALTVLFSEISSRKRLGKPVTFLSKEKAKEYNRKAEAKQKNKDKTEKLFSKPAKTDEKVNVNTKVNTNVNTNTGISTTASANSDTKTNVNQNLKSTLPVNKKDSPKIFEAFTSSFSGVSNKEKEEKNKAPEKERKALINFSTLKKGVGILLAAGFTLSFLKNSSLTKNSKLVKGIQNFGKTIKKKIYEPLVFKNFEMPETDFENITKSLKDVGCKEIAEGHEYIKGKYATVGNDGIIRVLKSSLPNDKKAKVIDTVKGTFKDIPQIDEITKSLSTAIKTESGAIAENKFDKVAQKTKQILKNKGISLEAEQAEMLSDTITQAISSHVNQTPIKTEKFIKPFVDIFIEPFKFIYSALRLPFKIVSTLVRLVDSPIEKKVAQAELGKLADGKKITKVEKGIHKAVTEVLGERSPKSGNTIQNIFVNTMEQLKKQTAGYQKKATEYSKYIANNEPKEKIEAAKKSMLKAKSSLERYINGSIEKSFNGVTQSNNKNTDLAMMTKIASSTVTSLFLVQDNYNMVMLKSDGENKAEAKEKANERIIQRLSAMFYQTMLINWFNSTFRSIYNSSLKGMAAIAAPNTLTTEVITRKSIGMPIGRKTYEQLVENEEKNENRKGFLGKYFKFMRLLTGKKPLKDRMPKNKTGEVTQTLKQAPEIKEKDGTNLLKKYMK